MKIRIKCYELPSYLNYSPVIHEITDETIFSLVKEGKVFIGSWALTYCQSLMYSFILENFSERKGIYSVTRSGLKNMHVFVAVTGKWHLVLTPQFFQEIVEEQSFVPLSHSEMSSMKKIYHLLTKEQKQKITQTELHREANFTYWRSLRFMLR